MRAILALEDGTIFEGNSFGVKGERTGEVVFNTAMTGYQEILTDPSYRGQMVCMTYTLMGNYGVNDEDVESGKLWLECFIVKEASRVFSNYRGDRSISDYLKKNRVMGIEGIDTRALTRHIRLQGAMKAVISTVDFNRKSLVKKAKEAPSLVGRDLVKEVTSRKGYDWNSKGRHRVVVIDCGVKYNILRKLDELDCHVKVVPAKTSAGEILGMKPDGVLVSNGPGDPAAVTYAIETVSGLLGKLPVFGICLGHQLIGLALGGRTYKLKFGHHGANHPVMDVVSDRISITSQNHGFCVDMASLKGNVELTHVNLNDKTVEGLRNTRLKVSSVQFHPEASPGPRDAAYLFNDFVKSLKKRKKTTRRVQ